DRRRRARLRSGVFPRRCPGGLRDDRQRLRRRRQRDLAAAAERRGLRPVRWRDPQAGRRAGGPHHHADRHHRGGDRRGRCRCPRGADHRALRHRAGERHAQCGGAGGRRRSVDGDQGHRPVELLAQPPGPRSELDARRHPQPDLTSIFVRRGLALLAAALLLAGCGEAKKPPKAALELRPVTFAELPGWSSDRPSEAVPALKRRCARFAKLPAERSVGPDKLAGTIAEWQPLCTALAALPDGDDAAARSFFETWFTPFLAASSFGDDGLFTGYYEPELRGSRVRDDAHPAPLYRIPDDLITVDLG